LKISLNWLKDYIDLSGISKEEILQQLTMSGLEVENVIDQNEIYSNFVIGYVKEKGKHPNADKLSLCKVSTGGETYNVVCGAPNVAAGQYVIFAKVGAVIPKDNFKLGKAKIRGVESYGMICSEAELELGPDQSGILILNGDFTEGTPVTDALALNDIILEIGITPNRSDALSHIGVARELAAIFNLQLKIPSDSYSTSSENINKLAAVEIEDAGNCPRYSAAVVTNIKIEESPVWMKQRLTNIGLRPINNIVDITNYVMYECGQPLHAFDLDLLAENKIIVRSLTSEKKFTTLDSKERLLPEKTLMICDAESEVAIAGVMGGENSEITSSTKNILIESAYFNPSSVRRTSKTLGLSTEASYRFERSTNPDNTVFAAKRTAKLITELSGGDAADGIIDVYPAPIEEKIIKVRFERISKVLGYHLSTHNVKQILQNLSFIILNEDKNSLEVKVPNFRPDIEREIDLIEEVARINGYDNIPAVEKINITFQTKIDESEFADNARHYASALGFYEAINNPLQSEKLASYEGNKIQLLNPLSSDMAFLRTSLIPGILTNISYNINVGEKDLSLFEIGNTFNKTNEAIASFNDFIEEQKLIFAVTGNQNHKEWNRGEEKFDFFTLKGLINSFLFKLTLDNIFNDSYSYTPDRIYEFKIEKFYKNMKIGAGGKIKKAVLSEFDIEQEVFCFEFCLDKLKQVPKPVKQFDEPLRYPKIVRDFAFIFDKSVSNEDVVKFLKQQGSSLLKSVKIFDLFEHPSLGDEKKSMAYTLEFYDKNKTLTEDEVEKEFAKLITSTENKFHAKLRG
jgi:phenylalanyl-tRNA synthetase beta chain